MLSATYSLEPVTRYTFTETARDVIHDFKKMSNQTKARLELVALLVTLIITCASALKVFVYLPPRVDKLEADQGAIVSELQAVNLNANSTDIAIAKIEPQLAAINEGISDLKQDIRDMRRTKSE